MQDATAMQPMANLGFRILQSSKRRQLVCSGKIQFAETVLLQDATNMNSAPSKNIQP